MTVVDASAVLAFLLGETGSDLVEGHLSDGAVCGAANWSEVAQKVRAAGRDWDLVRALLLSYSLTIEPVDASDAEHAARLWRRGWGCRSPIACASRSASGSTPRSSRPTGRGVRAGGSNRSATDRMVLDGADRSGEALDADRRAWIRRVRPWR